jgi:cytochrome b pre-mRNA-processing protein 3
MGSRVSLLARLLKPKPDPREALRPLWHAIVERSRDPAWYREDGVADSVAGRFDMIVAMLSLVLLRLEPERDTAPAQVYLTELFVEDMDGQLRETGVGDPVIGKHVGRLVSALGGRLGAFRDGLGNAEAWTAAVQRNVSLRDGAVPERPAARLLALRDALARAETSALLKGELPR